MDELSPHRWSKCEYRLLQLGQFFLVDTTKGGSVLTRRETQVTVLDDMCVAIQNCHCFLHIGETLDLVKSLSNPKDERCECTGPATRYPAKCKGRRSAVIEEQVVELVAHIADGIHFGLVLRQTTGNGSNAPANGAIKECLVLALLLVLAPVRLLAGPRTVVFLMTSGASPQDWSAVVDIAALQHVELKGVCADVQTLLPAGGTGVGTSVLSLCRCPFFSDISTVAAVHQFLAQPIFEWGLEDLLELTDGINVPRGVNPPWIVVEEIAMLTAAGMTMLVRTAIKDANGHGMLLHVDIDTNLDEATPAPAGIIAVSRPLVARHLLLHCKHGPVKVYTPGLRIDPVHGAVTMAVGSRLDLEGPKGR